jgi:WD40 repeat protein
MEKRIVSRIFISHSGADREKATLLADWLQQQGHSSYFLDFDPEKGITAGKDWEAELYRHLRQCRAMIALVSPNWLKSRWCFAEVTQARAAGKPVFLAKIAPCSADRLFADVQRVDLAADPAGGYRSLARGLKEVGIDPRESFERDPSRPPYPGLLAFEELDAAMFFGRDRDIQHGLELLDGLRRTGGASFVLCLGASGSGKSSLLRAGLIPRLRKDSAAWLPVTPFRPQENPFEELAIALAHTFAGFGETRDWRSVQELLQASSTNSGQGAEPSEAVISGEGLRTLARDLRVAAKRPNATVLLTIDQTEELFGYSDPQKARAFLQRLRHALETGGKRLMAIATMRSDTVTGFQAHPDLQGFAYEPWLVASVPLRDLPQTIEGPAAAAGIVLEPGLAQALVHDATSSDALPLLAFTLRELYERYGQDGRLDIKEYEALGRLEGSVRRAADAVMERMSPGTDELNALRTAFAPAMVRVNEEGEFTRRRAQWLSLPARAHRLLQSFVDARLLVSRGEGGERLVEVAHEALLRAWPRLQDWLKEDRDNLRLLEELKSAAEDWQTHDRADSWLLHRGDRLAAVESMMQVPRFAGQAGQAGAGYVSACSDKRREEEERAGRQALSERRRLEAEVKSARRAFVIAVIAFIAIGAALFGWYQARAAAFQTNERAVAQSKALSTVARQLTDDGNATLGAILALEALPEGKDGSRPFVADAEAALLHALFAQREQHVLLGHTDGINQARFSPDGALLATASRDKTARLWDTATGKTIAKLEGHSGQIYWIGFSSDGRRVVTASSDGTARIWDVKTAQAIAVLRGHDGDIYRAAFSPDGGLIVTASADGTARLWRAATGEALAKLEGHNGAVYSAEFSRDGARVVTASEDKTARIWDAASGRSLFVLNGHEDQVLDASFSPDGRRVATASQDKTARLWDAASGAAIAVLRGHAGGVERAQISPDGRFLVTASADSAARLWDAVSGAAVAVLEGHQGQVYDAAFSPDSQWLVTASDDGTARLWNVETRQPAAVLGGHFGPVWSASFSADGKRVATASDDSTAHIWSTETHGAETMLSGHSDYVYGAVFSPDGNHVLTVSKDGSARLWDAAARKPVSVMAGHSDQVYYAAFSRDGQRIATVSADGTAKLWNSEGVLEHTLTGHTDWVLHADFSPDGRFVATASRDGTAKIWDAAGGRLIRTLEGHGEAVNFIAYSHKGGQIVTASYDHTARIWDAATGRLIHSLEGHEHQVETAAYSPDDTQLATASFDGTARLWSTESGKETAVLRGHTAAIWTVAYAPDGQRIVTSSWDNTARIWDAASGGALSVLQGHQGRVVSASFSPDGRLALTASWDGTARLWHSDGGQPVATLRGHRNYVISAAFSPSGRQIATASWDGTARIWNVPLAAEPDWTGYARRTLPRGITEDERRRYLGR